MQRTLSTKNGNVKEIFLKPSKIYKEAKFNDRAKFGLIREIFKSDQGMLQFVSLKEADMYEEVKETCLEYADNQKVFGWQSQEEQVTNHEQGTQSNKRKEKFQNDTAEMVGILC